jgi:hypothetical protein
MEGMLGGIVGLVGAGLQASAQAAQVQYEYAALNWQKQRAREQDRFAQASREDMFGNVTGYDEALNKWGVTLAPDQKSIRDAGQKEQLLQLTKDAPAARALREKIQQRAKAAEEPFLKASLGYQFNQPQSEGAIRSDLSQLMATNDMLRSKADQALLTRQAIRMGQGGKAADIILGVDQELGKGAQNRMLEARKMALGEHAQRLQQHEAEWGTPMKVWGDIMNQGGNAPNIPNSTLSQSLDNAIQQQQAGMSQAFQAGTAGVGSAMQSLAQAIGKSPNLSGISFGGGGRGGTGAAARPRAQRSLGQPYPTDPYQDTYDPTTYSEGFSSYAPSSSWDNRSSEGWA